MSDDCPGGSILEEAMRDGDTIAELEVKVASLQADNDRLRDALNRDKTGLVQALSDIRTEVHGRRWLVPEGGWSSYSYEEHTKKTLRKEIAWALDAIDRLAMAALNASGTLATETLRAKEGK